MSFQSQEEAVPKILLTTEEEKQLMSPELPKTGGFHGSGSTGGETPSSGTGGIISSHKRKAQKKRKKKGIKKLSIGSNSSSHSSSATTHISLSSLKESEHILKSPRFSPLPKYDRYYRDSLLKVNSEFPGAQSGVPKGNLFRNIRELPESVKEEQPQENLSGDDESAQKRRHKIDIFMDCDEFNRGRNSASSMGLTRKRGEVTYRRHKSVDERDVKNMREYQFVSRGTRTPGSSTTLPLIRSHSSKWLEGTEMSVPEEKEEEDINSPLVSSLERFLRTQKRVISDDFELNYDGIRKSRFVQSHYITSSYAQSIKESDSEGEDNSSETDSIFSGTSSFKAKHAYLDVEKLIDKLEPLEELQTRQEKADCSSIQKPIEEPIIEEEKVDEEDERHQFLKQHPEILNELKKHHKHQEQFEKLSEHVDEIPSSRKLRMRSSSFNSEPIVEVDEAGVGDTDDPLHHHFRISRTVSLFGKKRKSERISFNLLCESPLAGQKPRGLDISDSENSSEVVPGLKQRLSQGYGSSEEQKQIRSDGEEFVENDEEEEEGSVSGCENSDEEVIEEEAHEDSDGSAKND